MIIAVITLCSLCALYFTRLLSRKGMKIAAICVSIVYIYFVAWIYALFILDVADLGFSDTETQLTLLHGSNIYHSFVSLTNKMSSIPLEMLEAVVTVALTVFIASLVVVFHGIIEITKAVIQAAKGNKRISMDAFVNNHLLGSSDIIKQINIIRLHCRMNC